MNIAQAYHVLHIKKILPKKASNQVIIHRLDFFSTNNLYRTNFIRNSKILFSMSKMTFFISYNGSREKKRNCACLFFEKFILKFRTKKNYSKQLVIVNFCKFSTNKKNHQKFLKKNTCIKNDSVCASDSNRTFLSSN